MQSIRNLLPFSFWTKHYKTLFILVVVTPGHLIQQKDECIINITMNYSDNIVGDTYRSPYNTNHISTAPTPNYSCSGTVLSLGDATTTPCWSETKREHSVDGLNRRNPVSESLKHFMALNSFSSLLQLYLYSPLFIQSTHLGRGPRLFLDKKSASLRLICIHACYNNKLRQWGQKLIKSHCTYFG